MILGLAAGATIVVTLACESPEARRAREAAVSRTKISAESARAVEVVARPSAGLWNDAQLAKRLVDAGLAPQHRDSVRAQPWMGVPVLAYRVGVATVDAYVYHDSTARKSVAALLDPVTLAPAGKPSPWGLPRELVQNGNLIAIVVGGTDRQQERVATALAAGVGAP